jgi:hypothetical protein
VRLRAARNLLAFSLALSLAWTSWSQQAWAGPSSEDRALALELFDQGRELLASGHVDEACRKLEESDRLDPLPGALLNVAVCHERQGRAASAVAELREARALAVRDGRADRVAFADKHLGALEGKVSTVLIVVPPEADVADLTITRDASPIGRPAWSTPIPVDPGEHVIVASASNRIPRSLKVVVGPDGDAQTITILPLETAPPPPASLPAPAAPLFPVGPTQVPAPEPSPSGLSARRTAAVVSAGLGLVSLSVGAYFGARAIAKHDDPDAVCTLQPCTMAHDLNADAATSADVSTVTIAAGLATVAVAAFLWLGDRASATRRPGVVVWPAVAPNRTGLQFAATF